MHPRSRCLIASPCRKTLGPLHLLPTSTHYHTNTPQHLWSLHSKQYPITSYTMTQSPLRFLFLILHLCTLSAGSTLAMYKDSDCQVLDVRSNITALDGFPDGECGSITAQASTETWKSFKFLLLGDGCSPTVYDTESQPDNSCSGTAVAASIDTCYNTTCRSLSRRYPARGGTTQEGVLITHTRHRG